MIKNKKGGIGTQWLIAISFLFMLTFLFITFNNIYSYSLAPTFIGLLNNDSAGQQAEEGINFYMSKYNYVFYILFFVDLLYMFMLLIKEEPVESSGGFYR
jgi:hypothetical protein